MVTRLFLLALIVSFNYLSGSLSPWYKHPELYTAPDPWVKTIVQVPASPWMESIGHPEKKEENRSYLSLSQVQQTVNELQTITNPSLISAQMFVALQQISQLEKVSDKDAEYQTLLTILQDQAKKYAISNPNLSQAFNKARNLVPVISLSQIQQTIDALKTVTDPKLVPSMVFTVTQQIALLKQTSDKNAEYQKLLTVLQEQGKKYSGANSALSMAFFTEIGKVMKLREEESVKIN